jgi:hypothetical protein
MLAEFVAVAGIFLVRIGVPLLVLILIGAMVEKSYRSKAA